MLIIMIEADSQWIQLCRIFSLNQISSDDQLTIWALFVSFFDDVGDLIYTGLGHDENEKELVMKTLKRALWLDVMVEFPKLDLLQQELYQLKLY